MNGESFSRLGRGDVVKNEVTGEFYLVDQVRLEAFYICVRCDEKGNVPQNAGRDPLAVAKFTLRSGENLAMHRKALA